MAVSFKSIKTTTRRINPLKDFTLEDVPLEIRYDPLTGRSGRVLDTGFNVSEKPNLSPIIEKSKEIFCPFCPETLEKSTPLFPEDLLPEGRVQVGEATLIPNLLPLDKYPGVSIFSHQHYIPLDKFTPDVMRDAFSAALIFIQRVLEFDPDVGHCYINWNYMPPAGSSLVHPHLQVNCGETATNQHREQLEGCKRYNKAHGTNFWHDFMEQEITLKSRYIGEIGPVFWSLSFVPNGYLPDVLFIFPDHKTVAQLDESSLLAFLKGLSRILLYFHSENIFSFNMSLFSVREDAHFRLNGRVTPRLLTRDIGNSDRTYSQVMHQETYSVIPPESVCRKVNRIFFKGALS